MDNDKALIKKCQNGNRQAFDMLIRRYYEYVYGFLLKTAANKEIAEDLTQETFLKMIQNIERYDLHRSTSFGTWIIAIGRNCYIDYLRRNKINFEDIDAVPVEDMHNVASEVERKVQYEQIIDELSELPDEQSLVIKMKYIEDMTLAEISRRLNVKQKTIKSRIHDGTVKIRKRLEKKYEVGSR